MLKRLLTSVTSSFANRKRISLPQVTKGEQLDHPLLRAAENMEANGKINEAIDAYKHFLSANRKNVVALIALGRLCSRVGQFGDAVHYYEAALNNEPHDRNLLMSLAGIYFRSNLLEEAEDCYNRILVQSPGDAGAHNNIGNVFLSAGNAVRAAQHFRKSILLKPENKTAHSNLLFCLNYLDNITPEDVYQEHLLWARSFAPTTPDDCASTPSIAGSKIRIGYVSPNFNKHSVAYFIEPLLQYHDKSKFEIICYDDKDSPDEITNRLISWSDKWRVIATLSDDVVAATIQRDNLDIIVDLAGHTSTNRLSLFARRLAPIQISYLGYPNTTGLQAMDFRLTDNVADPPGLTERYYSETLKRVPCAWCYRPPDDVPSVGNPRSNHGAPITFGSFNKLAKISSSVLTAWVRLLHNVPNSNLFLKSSALQDLSVARKITELFAGRGIEPSRLRLEGFTDSTYDHLAAYSEVDIALDTFPYCGTTTTCEALYMGTPVLTLTGRTHVSRVGTSILSCVGLADLIATSENDYVGRATALASDREKLNNFRKNLRYRLQHSRLMDGADFSRQIENAYIELVASTQNSRKLSF